MLCPSCAARPPPVHPELFVCVECALRGVGLPAAGAGSASQQAEWVRLVHGADSLASARHRASTRGAYHRAVADFVDFCRARGVEPLPAQPEAVRAHVFHCTADRGLDAQTVEGRMSALGDWHGRQSSALVRVGRPALGNPCRTAPVTELLAVVRRTCRTGHRGRLPLTRSEFKGMCAFGFDLSKASGHHTVVSALSSVGCLRRKAAVSLRVSYTVSGSIISFSSSSGVYIAYDRETQMEYIGLRVNVDKNVDSSIEAHAYIPAAWPRWVCGLLRCYGITFFGSGLPLAATCWQPLGPKASVRPPSTQGCTPAWAGPTGRRTCGPFLMPAHGLPTCPGCLLTLAASPFHSGCGTLTSLSA